MNLQPVIVVVLFLLLLAVVGAVLKGIAKARSSPSTDGRYELRQTIVSPAERSFLGILVSVVPQGVAIMPKVRLGDVFKPRTGLSHSERTTADNRINRKHVDFLLVRESDLAPLAGIELDDKSHDREVRRQRDQFVDDLFRSCALPLIHFPASATYNSNDLRATVGSLLKVVTS